ncbi:hypothetical protein SAMN05444405_10585 [Bacteroides luti]|jgi:hypothetical protein|uniref:Uncharacterized protein n=1 Tax=Bacteroides luti TaxID=1297750 RepID=A0A1M4YUF5_9BACE|nr:hypothetical protein SAMN05444405_10585 [Bacteroides luti]
MNLFLVQKQTFKIGQMQEQAKKMRTFALQIIYFLFAS